MNNTLIFYIFSSFLFFIFSHIKIEFKTTIAIIIYKENYIR